MDTKTTSVTTNRLEDTYFDLQAEIGITKHLGGVESTRELMSLCDLQPDQHVLDVGCGAGLSIVYLVQHAGVRVTGVDLRPGMVRRAQQRAVAAGIGDRTTFHIADICNLPFEDDTFDAVLCQSVLAFVDDKPHALAEMFRVTRPGGCVGINEAIWIKPPPAELVDYFGKYVGVGNLLTAHDWHNLLPESGLEQRVIHSYEVTPMGDAGNQIRMVGWKNLLPAWGRAIAAILRRPNVRAMMKGALRLPRVAVDYMGYLVAVGRKPDAPSF